MEREKYRREKREGERERQRQREQEIEKERERKRNEGEYKHDETARLPAMQCTSTRPLISSTRSINFFASPMTDIISSDGESRWKKNKK